ncbi:MAG: glycosyltransferase family 39 protein [Sphingomonas adhaesiva]|uniref:hypothetical protein n=1 Tax=Sphingomonas adhaesiva TaxID=28212 RepID=UPI002FF9BB1B
MALPLELDRPARAALLLALVAVAARIAMWGNPATGFDEQYYLLVGDRMLHGALVYVDIWDRKPIGLFLIFAAIRLLGGDGVLHYQVVATLAAWATACVLYRVARRGTGAAGALAAGAAYLLWLDFTEGEGGQSAVFYNLPMAIAAALVLRHVTGRPRRPTAEGVTAMLLVGIALQIKYSVVFEGMFFGLALLWTAWRRGTHLPALAGHALALVAAALLPTAIAVAAYWRAGALDAFVFANFLSILGKEGGALADKATGWLLALAILAPLWIAALLAPRGANADPARRFAWGWLAAAIVGLIPFVNGPNPNALPPALLPLALLAAPGLDRRPGRTLALLATIFVVGQVVLQLNTRVKGTRAQAYAFAAAATPRQGCLYVYDGYPVLYHLTHTCLPTRYAFPGLLNTRSEDNAAALGVDPAAEVRRILATRPEKIADVLPAFGGGNPRTRALVEAALARDYRATFEMRTGGGRRIVYTRRDAVR